MKTIKTTRIWDNIPDIDLHNKSVEANHTVALRFEELAYIL